MHFLRYFIPLVAFTFSAQASALTVVLDTGHTSKRPGSISEGGKPEYAFNLQLSNEVADALDALGITVIRVAADGEEIALTDRTDRTAGADLFVSVHHDSIQQAWIDAGRRTEFSGFAVLVSQKNPAFVQSLSCAKWVGAGMVAAGEHPSLYHATPIKGENRPLLDKQRGVHRFDDLIVLKTSKAPALLVEAGVIANPNEEDRLANRATAQKLGASIAQGIVQCLRGGK